MKGEGLPDGAPSLDLSKLIGSVLSDPAALSALTSLIGGMMQSRTGNDQQPVKELDAQLSPEGGTVSAFTKPAEEPLPSAVFSPQEDAPPFASHLPPSAHAQSVPPIKDLAPPPPHHPSHRIAGDRRRLFEALKPFLSRQRCEALDYILRISELLDVIGIGRGGNR